MLSIILNTLILCIVLYFSIEDSPSTVLDQYKKDIESLSFPTLTLDHNYENYKLLFHSVRPFLFKINGNFSDYSIHFTNSSILFQLKVAITHKPNDVKFNRQFLCELLISNLKFTTSDRESYRLVETAVKLNSDILENDLSYLEIYALLQNSFKSFQDKLIREFTQTMTDMAVNYPLNNVEYNFKSFTYNLENHKWFNGYYWVNYTHWIINIKMNEITYDNSANCISEQCKFSHVNVDYDYILQTFDWELTEINNNKVVYDGLYFGRESFSFDKGFNGHKVISHLIRNIIERENKYYLYKDYIK